MGLSVRMCMYTRAPRPHCSWPGTSRTTRRAPSLRSRPLVVPPLCERDGAAHDRRCQWTGGAL